MWTEGLPNKWWMEVNQSNKMSMHILHPNMKTKLTSPRLAILWFISIQKNHAHFRQISQQFAEKDHDRVIPIVAPGIKFAVSLLMNGNPNISRETKREWYEKSVYSIWDHRRGITEDFSRGWAYAMVRNALLVCNIQISILESLLSQTAAQCPPANSEGAICGIIF